MNVSSTSLTGLDHDLLVVADNPVPPQRPSLRQRYRRRVTSAIDTLAAALKRSSALWMMILVVALVVLFLVGLDLFFAFCVQLLWNDFLVPWFHWPQMPFWIAFIIVLVLGFIVSKVRQSRE